MRNFRKVGLIVLPVLSLTLAAIAGDSIKFEDVTAKSGLKGGGKASWCDVNNDQRPDVIINGILFLNNGDGTFSDITEKAGLKGNPKGAAVAADFNNDGITDIYFSGGEGALYLGAAGTKFTKGQADKNSTKRAMSASAVDLDGDGWLDLYIANYEEWQGTPRKGRSISFPDMILRNDKGKLVLQWVAPKEYAMPGRGVACCDFNNDGKMDLYISNYRLCPNFLWLNKGKWERENVATESGCAGTERKKVVFKTSSGASYKSSGHTIGSLWEDFDNDGLFDLFVGNFSHPQWYQDRPQFLKNGGAANNYRFIDKSAIAAIPWQESYAAPSAADIDNDGNIDLFFTTVYKGDNSRLFRNKGNWKFSDVTKEAGIDSARTYQSAFADFDNDGRMDLLTGGKLYRNVSKCGDWLKVKLQMKYKNLSAVGAKVFVKAGDKTLSRQVERGTGTGSQNDPVLHFGLGKAGSKVNVTVVWPDGRKQQQSVPVNQLVTITESLNSK